MRRTERALAWLVLGAFVACKSEPDHDDPHPGAGATGGASAGASGLGGSAGSTAGTHGGAGTAGSPGSSGAAGAAGAPAQGGGSAGRPEGGGGAGGSAGTVSGAGTAGEGGLNGEAGTPAEAGAPSDGGAPNEPVGLSWPVDCVPGDTCTHLGYPDIDNDGDAFDCSDPGYVGHQGTDIDTAAGTPVRAAADGVVVFAFDGKYDQCPNANEPDCQDPPSTSPGSTAGNTVCTPSGPYCGTGSGDCFWCFAGGNVLVIRHEGVPGVFATRYDHLKKDSVLVAPGDSVTRGQKIAEAGSSGSSTTPHLHFEVWGTGFYELAEPWAGTCGPNRGSSLWAYDPPWSE